MMTLPKYRLALGALSVTSLMVACGGPTTIDFVGAPDGEGGDKPTGGSHGDGGGNNLGGLDGGGGTGGGQVIVITEYCGDGEIDPDSEACDDGNQRSLDGCNPACQVEALFSCSGEPSVCTTHGNGTLEADEECDDGNLDDDDGCSADGFIEGTCEEPQLLELEDDPSGQSVASVTVDTSAGGASLAASACGGLSSGAGLDRIYQVDLPPGMADLVITLDSDFDGILRFYGGSPDAACDADQEGLCTDDVGARATETLHLRGVEGSIFLAVDGAQADDVGQFTLTVSTECVLDHLKVHRITSYFNVGNNSVLSLKNTSDYCAVDLGEVGLVLSDDFGSTEAQLPSQLLPPRGVFRGSLVVDPSVNPNSFDFDATLSAFDSIASGAFLCVGPCDLVDGTNVMDAMVVGGATIPFPDVTFGPSSLPNIGGAPHLAHVRVAYDGKYPAFTAADWSPATSIDPDDLAVLDFGARVQTDALAPLFLTADAEQGTILRVPARSPSTDYSYYFNLLSSLVSNPTYISYRYKQPPEVSVSYGCYLGFGMDPGAAVVDSTSWNETLGTHYTYPEPSWPDVYLSGYGYVEQPAETWHQVELTDINWTMHTFDLWQDGDLLQEDALFNDQTDTSTNILSFQPYGENIDCDYTDIIVRNGPPGRAWESSPVLP